ncbi:MAG: hypothetical protein M1823_006032 [Watsoniomyces obsoletus]|nr:MAG: hypothetical protein M1823_006032 [Watsoniomyces obsoletus]
MPTVYSPDQRDKIARVVAHASVSERTAARFLKANHWNPEHAADAYFRSTGAVDPARTAKEAPLNTIFNSFRDAPQEEPDRIGVEGAMRYLQALNVQLDDIVVLALSEALDAPSMGEFHRKGFLNGWINLKAETLPKQQSAVTTLRGQLSTDTDLFKRVYKHAFQLARPSQQKYVPLETAIDVWRTLFTSLPSLTWSTPDSPFLDWWQEYLETKFKRPINKDIWIMLFEFRKRSLEDESLDWWDPEGAWPGVLDDFVVWMRGKRSEMKTD